MIASCEPTQIASISTYTETQRADGLTVRGNRGKINEGSDRERGGGGEVETETERQNH